MRSLSVQLCMARMWIKRRDMDNLQGGDALFLSQWQCTIILKNAVVYINLWTQYTTTLAVVLRKSYQQTLFRYSISWHTALEYRLQFQATCTSLEDVACREPVYICHIFVGQWFWWMWFISIKYEGMKSQAYNAHITMFLNLYKTIRPQWAFLVVHNGSTVHWRRPYQGWNILIEFKAVYYMHCTLENSSPPLTYTRRGNEPLLYHDPFLLVNYTLVYRIHHVSNQLWRCPQYVV